MNRTKIKVLLFVSLSFSMPLWARALNQNSPKSIQENTQGITVAIIDTGVDAHHPLLQGSLWTNPGESGIDEAGRDKSQNGIDDDGNGFVDDVHGWNFADNNNQLSDLHGHGTHIAGIIQRMSPKTNIMILKYYDPKASGGDNLTNTVKAIRYATQMKARIINYSGGGTLKCAEEENAIRKAQLHGILFVAAAGNEKSNSDLFGFYPANYGLSNIISVTAIDENLRVLPSSNYGSHSVDIAAPGKSIISSLPGGGFGAMTGTSQATAFVSGAAAQLLAENQAMKEPEEVIRHLIHSGDFNDLLFGKTKHQTTLNLYHSLVMKDSKLGAFGNEDNAEGTSPLDFSAKLDPESEDLGREELPFKTQNLKQGNF